MAYCSTVEYKIFDDPDAAEAFINKINVELARMETAPDGRIAVFYYDNGQREAVSYASDSLWNQYYDECNECTWVLNKKTGEWEVDKTAPKQTRRPRDYYDNMDWGY